MASAEKKVKIVEKVITEEVPDGIKLSLNDEEAEALVAVLRRVGGMPVTSRRGLSQGILEALTNQGVRYGSHLEHDLEGRVYFQGS